MLPVASESFTHNATRADSAAIGSGARHVPRQAAASSIQVGISRSRTTLVPAGLQHAQDPVARSTTSCSQTGCLAHGCHA